MQTLRFFAYPLVQEMTKTAVLRVRIGQVFGSDYAERLIVVRESTSYISACGLLCSAEQMRRSRNERFLYVNGRIVRSPSLQHAVMSAYEGMVSTKRYPFYVLFLSLDPKHVDVNVHPAKTEVRFDSDRDVYGFMRAVVRKALGSADLVPQFSPSKLATLSLGNASSQERSKTMQQASSGEQRSHRSAEQLSNTLYAPTDADKSTAAETTETAPQVWQLHNQYICTALRTGLMILDQRAAHERILYERALHQYQGRLGTITAVAVHGANRP